MLKKNYQKPTAEYIAFYSDEEIAAEIPLGSINAYADESGDGTIISGTVDGGSMEPGIK